MTCGGREALHERMNRSFSAPAGARAHPVAHARAATGGSSERPNTMSPRCRGRCARTTAARTSTARPPRRRWPACPAWRPPARGRGKSGITQSDTSSGPSCIAARDVLCRDGEVGMAERHALRASGAAAGVQDERHVVECRRGDRRAPRHLAERHHAARARLHRQDRHGSSGRAGPRPCRRAAAAAPWRWCPRGKTELVFLVAGVERGGRARHRRGQERHHRATLLGRAMPTRSPRRMPNAANASARSCTCRRNSP